MALFTLREMGKGGIYDQLGGGFHRYSVDAQWLVPHFEKMLYDNALLASAYLESAALRCDERSRQVGRSTLDYLLRELQARHGLAYLFISHDLRVVRAMAHRILVMKDGRVVESGETEQVMSAPREDYTRVLMAAAFETSSGGPLAVPGGDEAPAVPG